MATQINHEHPVIDRAVAQFEAAKQRLHRSDGQPVYAEPEMAERVNALLAQFDAAVRPLVEAADAEVAQCRRAWEKGQRDPLEKLTGDELGKAAAGRWVIEELARNTPVEDLTDRLLSEHENGDKVSRTLWRHYALVRLGDEQARGAREEDLRGFRAALRAIEGDLADPHAKEQAEELRLARKEAARLGVAATMARSRLDGSAAREEAVMRARYRI